MNMQVSLIENYKLRLTPILDEYRVNLIRQSETNNFQHLLTEILTSPDYKEILGEYLKNEQGVVDFILNINYYHTKRSWGLGLKPSHFYITINCIDSCKIRNNSIAKFCTKSFKILNKCMSLYID